METARFWLPIFGILVAVGGLYGYRHLELTDKANAALIQARQSLSAAEDTLESRKKSWADNSVKHQAAAAIMREAMAKEAAAEKALEAANTRERSVEGELKYLAGSLPAAIEKVRNEAVGAKFAELKLPNGKVLKSVTIKRVDEAEISVFHSEGSGVLTLETMPAPLIEQLDLGANPMMSEVNALVEKTKEKVAKVAVAAPEGSFYPERLVFIKTNHGSGSGFIARVDGKAYVYTNAHVICGNPWSGFTSKIVSIVTASGKKLSLPAYVELSDQTDPNAPNGLEDVARFQVNLAANDSAYEISDFASESSVLGQRVVAFGNSLGADVITQLKGGIMALGTDRVEISCEIVPGNSGGPVVLEDTQKVIGISTYAIAAKRDIWTQGTSLNGVRRFAVRPSKVVKWRKMLYDSLMMSLGELRAFDRDTLSLAAACNLNPKPNRGGFDVPSTAKGDYIIKAVIVDGSRFPLGAEISTGIAKVNQRLGGARGTFSVAAVVPVFAEFFSTVAARSASQLSSLRASDRAPYLKQFIPGLAELRQEIQNLFVAVGNSYR